MFALGVIIVTVVLFFVERFLSVRSGSKKAPNRAAVYKPARRK